LLPARLPLIEADGERISQVIDNLLSNAVKFSNAGGRVYVEASDEDAGVNISVRDEGIGIPEEEIPFLFSRFYRATSGELRIDGVPVNDIPLEELRAQIGIVSQESFLFNATVRENLLFGKPDADDGQIRAALAAANALGFVEQLPRGLDTHVGENGVKLSVGEKQRLSFARALLKDPPILILDEATASVDTATERLIQEALEHLLKNRTSFVIAHRLSTIQQADLICVIKAGAIIERGTHHELLALDGLYASLCRAQTLGETAEQTFEHLENKPS
jgi:ATP-binding cassette subfamily B protein/subfamily B ATP-binding cassette protein MsbA